MILLVALLIFIMEFVLSVLLNRNALSIIMRDPDKATVYSITSNVLWWGKLYIIGNLSDWSVPLIAADIAGDVLGDRYVASRKRKAKKPRVPVNI